MRQYGEETDWQLLHIRLCEWERSYLLLRRRGRRERGRIGQTVSGWPCETCERTTLPLPTGRQREIEGREGRRRVHDYYYGYTYIQTHNMSLCVSSMYALYSTAFHYNTVTIYSNGKRRVSPDTPPHRGSCPSLPGIFAPGRFPWRPTCWHYQRVSGREGWVEGASHHEGQ